jgi:protein-tyrosine-phosphatase
MTNALVVCHGNLCRSRFGPAPGRKTGLLGDFLSVPPHRTEDPWGHSDDVYAMTFERSASAVQRLAQVLEPSGW